MSAFPESGRCNLSKSVHGTDVKLYCLAIHQPSSMLNRVRERSREPLDDKVADLPNAKTKTRSDNDVET
jgi:hypothetical protein